MGQGDAAADARCPELLARREGGSNPLGINRPVNCQLFGEQFERLGLIVDINVRDNVLRRDQIGAAHSILPARLSGVFRIKAHIQI
jgi:hypothetical protein